MNILGNIEGSPTECVIRISTNDKVITGGDSPCPLCSKSSTPKFSVLISCRFLCRFMQHLSREFKRIHHYTNTHSHTHKRVFRRTLALWRLALHNLRSAFFIGEIGSAKLLGAATAAAVAPLKMLH